MSAPQNNYPNQSNTYSPPPIPPAPPTKNSRRGAIIATIIGVVALLIGVGIGSSSKGNTSNTASTAGATTTVTAQGAVGATVTEKAPAPVVKTVEKTVEKTVTAKPETKTVEATVTNGPPPAEFVDGVNLVGVDVQPGTYRSRNPQCYYERLSGLSGTFDDIIANGIGATVVTISPSDKGFKSQDCAPWEQAG